MARRGISSSTLAGLGVLCAFVVLVTLYEEAVPPWEGPDEVGHFAYVAHLVTTRTLPVQHAGAQGEDHQPPLHYVLAALATFPADLSDPTGGFRPNPRFIWAGQGGHEVNAGLHGPSAGEGAGTPRGHGLALRHARAVSAWLGLATVGLTLALGRELFPRRPAVAGLAAALVALNPQFLFVSSVVNNDGLLTVAATGAWWQLLRTIRRPERGRGWAAVGLWVAVAVLAKVSGPLVGLPVALTLVVCAVRRRSLTVLARGGAAAGLAVALGTGWWFARNVLQYGDPFGWTAYRQVFPDDAKGVAVDWHTLHVFAAVQFHSFWGVFGWMNIPAPPWFYVAAGALCLLGLVGLGLGLLSGRGPAFSGDQRAGLAVLGAVVLLQESALLWLATRCDSSCYQGRYLFPAVAPLMLLLATGLLSLPPRRLAPWVAAALLAALLGAAVFMPAGVIAPAYATMEAG